MEHITSASNKKIKNLIALQKQKKARNEDKSFVIEGLRIVLDAFLSAPELVKGVYMSESFASGENYREIEDAMQKAQKKRTESGQELFEVCAVEDRTFEAACETVTPQGILAVVKQPEYTLEEVLRPSQEKKILTAGGESGVKSGNGAVKLLILENIQDPGNLGTMFRTAEAAGMSGIIMSRGTVDIFSPKVTRSTMGSIFRVPFIYVTDLTENIDLLKNRGISVYAAYLRNGIPYTEADYSSSCAVMIGNEGNGLSTEAAEAATGCIYIPMAGKVESLNAAIASAVLMYYM